MFTPLSPQKSFTSCLHISEPVGLTKQSFHCLSFWPPPLPPNVSLITAGFSFQHHPLSFLTKGGCCCNKPTHLPPSSSFEATNVVNVLCLPTAFGHLDRMFSFGNSAAIDGSNLITGLNTLAAKLSSYSGLKYSCAVEDCLCVNT